MPIIQGWIFSWVDCLNKSKLKDQKERFIKRPKGLAISLVSSKHLVPLFCSSSVRCGRLHFSPAHCITTRQTPSASLHETTAYPLTTIQTSVPPCRRLRPNRGGRLSSSRSVPTFWCGSTWSFEWLASYRWAKFRSSRSQAIQCRASRLLAHWLSTRRMPVMALCLCVSSTHVFAHVYKPGMSVPHVHTHVQTCRLYTCQYTCLNTCLGTCLHTCLYNR